MRYIFYPFFYFYKYTLNTGYNNIYKCIKKTIQKVNMYVSSNRGIKNEQKKYIPKNEYIFLYSKIRI